MVNESEIISPSLLYHLHHHAFIFFPYSLFSLIPTISPNSSSFLTLLPFPKIHFPVPLPFSISFFPRFFFPFFCSFSPFPIWVSRVLIACSWVCRFVRGVAVSVSSPGVLK